MNNQVTTKELISEFKHFFSKKVNYLKVGQPKEV